MYLVYIDESGKPDYQDSEDFTLCALIVNEHDWQPLDNRIKTTKISHFPSLNDEDVELHAKVLVNGKEVFSSLSKAKREQLYHDALDTMQVSDVVIVASMIRKAMLKKKIDLELWGFRLLFERICWVLDKKNAELSAKGLANEYGILLIDSVRPSYDLKVRRKLLGFLRSGTYYVNNRFLIEDPIFVSSQYRNLSQLVDLSAWVIRRKFRPSNSSKDVLADSLFPHIEGKLDRDSSGNWNGVGLKIFP